MTDFIPSYYSDIEREYQKIFLNEFDNNLIKCNKNLEEARKNIINTCNICNNIPLISHKIWLTDNHPIPEKTLNLMERNYDNTKTWTHYLWTNNISIINYNKSIIRNISEFEGEYLYTLVKAYINQNLFPFATSVLRILIIRRYGGVYTDLGWILQPNFINLLNNADYILNGERDNVDKGIISHNLICCEKESYIFNKLINFITPKIVNKYYKKGGINAIRELVGPRMLTAFFGTYLNEKLLLLVDCNVTFIRYHHNSWFGETKFGVRKMEHIDHKKFELDIKYKVALCFWGITRSLKYTISSLQKNIFKILDDECISYHIYLHTYIVDGEYSNIRTNEKGFLDNEEYKLLLFPEKSEGNNERSEGNNNFKIDNQNEISQQLKFEEYRTFPDPWYSNYNCCDNLILSLYSKLQVTNLIINNNLEYNNIIFLRPDVRFVNEFDISWLFNKNNEVRIPNFHNFGGYNDRFFISNYKNGVIYGSAFNDLLEYSKIRDIHSEIFCMNYLNKHNLINIPIHFYFNRVRVNGWEVSQDSKEGHNYLYEDKEIIIYHDYFQNINISTFNIKVRYIISNENYITFSNKKMIITKDTKLIDIQNYFNLNVSHKDHYINEI